VGAPLGHARHHRQDRLRAIERLDLAFLIHAQHQRPIRRVQVQPDDVAHLVDEQRIGGELEGLGAVRLQTERTPNAHHRRLRQPARLGHRPTAPVRRVARLLVQGLGDHALDRRITDRARRPRPRLIEQPVETLRDEPRAPLADRLRGDRQAFGNLAIGAIGLCGQHDTCAHRQRL
jgi:hypothetical protein